MNYFFSAGEASGDLHASRLMAALKLIDRSASFSFLGGDLMAEAAGSAPLIHYRQMAYMGFSEVARHLPQVLGNLNTARRAITDLRPDALVLIDYPSFNLKLARHAAGMGIPVYYYISPKVWAWKEHRVKQIKRYVRRVYSILPFEVDFYKSRHGYDVSYVGNPSLEEVDRKLAEPSDRSRFLAANGIADDLPVLAIVPGSRRGEIRANLPIMAEVARQFPGFRPVLAAAPGIEPGFYDAFGPMARVGGDTFTLMRHAAAALVTSGTATLEAALIGVPQVVCYRSNGSRWAYELFKRILKIPYVSLPNLIAGREIVDEALLHLCTPDNVGRELAAVIPGGPRHDRQLSDYADMRQRLGTSSAADTTARLLLADLATLSR